MRQFAGKPLVAHAIQQAQACPFVDRVIVDTDSPAIAMIAKRFGADVPFLRPAQLAQDSSRVIDSIINVINRLKNDDGYTPTHVLLLQTTSPLREVEDILQCWQRIKQSKATSVISVCATRPKPKDLVSVKNNSLISAKVSASKNGVKLYGKNGFVFLVQTKALLKEKRFETKKTQVVICPEWRSVDIDVPEEWALAELIFKNKRRLRAHMATFVKKQTL